MIILVIQARMGSQRLPGKSMMDLCGVPLVGRILERIKRCTTPDKVVLATTDQPTDDVLADLANAYDIDCFRGSEHDLLDRYYQAAKTYGATVVARLPGDNPVPEPSEIDRMIQAHVAGNCPVSSNLINLLGNGYPDGIGVEVYDFEALQYVWEHVHDPALREHIMPCFYDHVAEVVVDPERFPLGTVACPKEFARPDMCLDVNTEEEYNLMAKLYADLYPQNPEFHITDIIRWYAAQKAI